jgi:hypothetical protein
MNVTFFLSWRTFLKNYFGKPDMLLNTLAYYCGQKKWDINVIVLTFNVK